MRLLYFSLLPLLLTCTAHARPADPLVTYDLTCDVDPDQAKMTVDTKVPIPDWLKTRKVTFRLSKLMETPRVEALDANGKATLLEVKQSGTTERDVNWDINIPAEAKSLRFQYANAGKKGFVFYLGPEGSYAGGYNETWYPRFGTYRGIGKMQFTVPTGYVVKASGKEAGVHAEGAKTRYSFDVPAPTVLTFATAKYTIKRIPGKLPVSLYLLKERSNSQDYAEGCRRVVDTLQREFGPYPYPDFSIIETPSPVSRSTGFSGASFEGFIFADSDSLDLPFNLAYFGHEIGHQWWGNLVQLEGAAGSYMLDEAMAQYGSLLTVERIQGSAVAARYRFDGYEDYSDLQCGRGAILFLAAGFDHPLSALPENSGASHDLADAKGFLAWDAIAREMGREKFGKAIRKVAKVYGWRSITLEQFLAEIRAVGGPAIEPHIQQWLYRRDLPNLSLEWKHDGRNLIYSIEQHTAPYRLTLPVVVQYADGTSARQMQAIDSRRTQVAMQVKKRVAAVLLDPDHEILHTTPQLQAEAHAKRFLTKGHLANLNGKADEARDAYTEGLKNLPEVDPYAIEFETKMRLAGQARVASRFEEAKALYEDALACPTRKSDLMPWLYLRYAMVCEKLGNKERQAWCLKNLVSAETALGFSSGAVIEAKRLKLLPP